MSLLWRRGLAFRIVLLFITGAIFGSLGDLCHVISQTDGYPAGYPTIPVVDLPFWVPLLFGGANLAIGFSTLWTDRILGSPQQGRPGLKSNAMIAVSLILLMTLWAASGFVPFATGGAKDVMMLAAAAGMWFAFDRSWQGLLLGIGTSIMGTAVEVSLVQNEIFFYHTPVANLFGVPSWLPLLYFCASITVGNFSRALREGVASEDTTAKANALAAHPST